MKKTVFILTLLLFCFLISCKSTNISETLRISDCELHSEYTTVYYGKSEQIEIGNHSFLSICLSPETKFNENSSLLYSLLVYDANDVQHQCYEDITIYPENYSKSNPVCKTIPDGYVILKVKYADENLTPCDFEITLSK